MKNSGPIKSGRKRLCHESVYEYIYIIFLLPKCIFSDKYILQTIRIVWQKRFLLTFKHIFVKKCVTIKISIIDRFQNQRE